MIVVQEGWSQPTDVQENRAIFLLVDNVRLKHFIVQRLRFLVGGRHDEFVMTVMKMIWKEEIWTISPVGSTKMKWLIVVAHCCLV